MQRFQHVPCPGCGCVCDDLVLTTAEGQLEAVEPNCAVAENWFRRHWRVPSQPHSVAGEAVELHAAVAKAVAILNAAEYPLIYGLSRADTSGQRAAVALADRLGGVIDSTASLCHGPSIMALQEVGEVTCTLGEIRNRADLVIFWGCDPAETHPRHAERYSVFPYGRFRKNGRSDRTVFLVGDSERVHTWRLNASADPADQIVAIAPGGDFEAVNYLRGRIRGRWVGPKQDHLETLLEAMRACEYGVVFFGLGLAKTTMGGASQATETGHNDVAALLSLVAELNAITRFTARRMRLQGDVSGADNVLLWQTGYPFGVDFSRGYPRYNPGEYTCNELLERGDVDACLLLGAETTRFLSKKAYAYLQSIPTIVIDYPGVQELVSADVHITTAVHGIHVPGTIYRMDNVPLSLRALTTATLPTDAQVLQAITEQCED